MSKMGFFKLWLKIVWKLRNVYSPLAVHIFDVFTDTLVIVSWLSYPDISGDNIDPEVMAISAFIVLIAHKIISFIAFWSKERRIRRCILQVFDLLIFEESKASQDEYDDAQEKEIQTTLTFKFVRNLEAIYESIPQSVLQLVFLIRTGWKSGGSGGFLVISILSILQSIVSMTNSILNNDNTYMSAPQWKEYKQRLPPTIPFMKHGISRLSEVIYRIFLCALFWIVCGGLPFGILMIVEFTFLIVMVTVLDFDIFEYSGTRAGTGPQGIDDYFLRLQMLIIMPSELVYALNDNTFGVEDKLLFKGWCSRMLIYFCGGCICGPCTCCIGPAAVMSTLCFRRGERFQMHMSARIGISMMELILLMIWPLFDQDRGAFLYSPEHGLSIFIVSIICYFIYTQYLYLFPDFELPYGIPVRTIYGYAFTGDLEELQRVKPATKTFKWNNIDPQKSKFPIINLNGSQPSEVRAVTEVLKSAFYGSLESLKEMPQEWENEIKEIEAKEDSVSRRLRTYEQKLTELEVQEEQDRAPIYAQWRDKKIKQWEQQQRNKRILLQRKYNPTLLNQRLKELARKKSRLETLMKFDVCVSFDGRYKLDVSINDPYLHWITPAMLALSNKQYDVVQWLEEERGSRIHKEIFNRQTLYDEMDDVGSNYLFARGHINTSMTWSAPYKDSIHGTCLLLALSNGNLDVVHWLLREKNVLTPKGYTGESHFATDLIKDEQSRRLR